MVQVDPEALSRFADQFESEVGAKLAAARDALQGARSLQYSDFTTVHVALAAVVVEAWNFQDRDLESKAQTASDFRTRLRATAEHWRQADDASTVRQDGAPA